MLLALFGALLISFAPVMVLLLPMGASEIALLRTGVGGLILLIFMLLFCRRELVILFENKKAFIFMAIAGSAFAVDMYIWNLSVLSIGAGLATVLANTQVFYMALWGRTKEAELISGLKMASLALGFGGLVLISTDSAAYLLNPSYGFGLLMGVLAGVAYFLYIIFLRSAVRIRPNIDPKSSLMVSSLVCAFWLLGHSIIWEGFRIESLLAYDALTWGKIIFLAVGVHIGGWYFIGRSFKLLTPSVVGICLLFQPVLSSLWGHLFFAEQFSVQQLLGIGLTLLGIAMVHFEKRINAS